MSDEAAKIVIIDDNPQSQSQLQKLLQESCDSDYEFLIASDGADGVELAVANGADCILLDHIFPGRSGLDILDELVDCAEEGMTPVIYLAGRDEDNVGVEALRKGAWDYILRNDVTTESLSRAVNKAIQKYRANRATHEKLVFTRSLLDAIPNPVYYENRELVITECNRSFESFTGRSREHIIGTSLDGFISDEQLAKYRETIAFLLKNPGNFVFESRFPGPGDDSQRDVIYNMSTYVEGGRDIRGIVTVITDITDRKKVEEKIKKLALYDALTGLPNRTLLFDRMALNMFRSQRYKDILAVLYLDLDGFKAVNDDHGHDTGDQVLIECASRLSGCIRRSDTICRYGGDEFVIVLGAPKSRENISTVCRKIISSIHEPFTIDGVECAIGASIGVSIYPDDGEKPDDLIRCADEAMYRVKHGGKNNFVFYS